MAPLSHGTLAPPAGSLRPGGPAGSGETRPWGCSTSGDSSYKHPFYVRPYLCEDRSCHDGLPVQPLQIALFGGLSLGMNVTDTMDKTE